MNTALTHSSHAQADGYRSTASVVRSVRETSPRTTRAQRTVGHIGALHCVHAPHQGEASRTTLLPASQRCPTAEPSVADQGARGRREEGGGPPTARRTPDAYGFFASDPTEHVTRTAFGLIASDDTEDVPMPHRLARTLGSFRDPDVGFAIRPGGPRQSRHARALRQCFPVGLAAASMKPFASARGHTPSPSGATAGTPSSPSILAQGPGATRALTTSSKNRYGGSPHAAPPARVRRVTGYRRNVRNTLGVWSSSAYSGSCGGPGRHRPPVSAPGHSRGPRPAVEDRPGRRPENRAAGRAGYRSGQPRAGVPALPTSSSRAFSRDFSPVR